MLRYFISGLLTLIFSATAAYGQSQTADQPMERRMSFNPSHPGLARFLDPAKISVTHSYSMAFGSNRAGSSAISLYNSTLAYKISSDMLFRVNLGVQSVLLQTGGPYAGNGKTSVLPGFDFTYRPGDNVLLQISYGTNAAGIFNGSYRSGQPAWAKPFTPVMSSPDIRDLRF